MSDTENDDNLDVTDEHDDTLTGEVRRVKRTFTMARSMGGANEADRCNDKELYGPTGGKHYLGSVIGKVTAVRIKEGRLPDGSPSQSICLQGAFEATRPGKPDQGGLTEAYFPRAYAEHAKAQFDANGGKEMDIYVDIYSEPTGKKPMSYEYAIEEHVLVGAPDPLARLRAMREKQLLKLAPPAKALPAPSVVSADTGGSSSEPVTVKSGKSKAA